MFQYFAEQDGLVPPVSCRQEETDACKPIYAGLNYTTYQVMFLDLEFVQTPSSSPAPRPYRKMSYKVVPPELNYLQAQSGDCYTSGLDNRVVAGMWGEPTGVTATERYGYLPTDATVGQLLEGGILQSDALLRFRMGGSYRVCYSNDGYFGEFEADIASRRIDVNGVFDQSITCQGSDCLSKHIYNCYLMRQKFNTPDYKYGLQTSCEVDFSYTGAGYLGNSGVGTWSSDFISPGYDSITGELLDPIMDAACTTTPADFLCLNGGACDTGDTFIDTTVVSETATSPKIGRGRIKMPTVRNDLVGNLGPQAFKPHTVAACYCPYLKGCQMKEYFVQQIGLMHFYLSKLCHVGDLNPDGSFGCANDYTGVTGQYRFRIRVECPTDACGTDGGSRVKLIAKDINNELPSWDGQAGCRTGLHGRIYMKDVFPPMAYNLIDGTDSGTVNEPNCVSALDCALSGGSRQDYKDFGGKFGFNFSLGYQVHEARTFDRTHDVDVCFCNRMCTDAANWFKTGGFRLSPTRLVSSATTRSSLPAQWAIEFVNQPGMLGLSRPYADAGVLGLQQGGLLKIVKDQGRSVRDIDCYTAGYNSQLTNGLSNEVAASMNYVGSLQTQNPPDLQKVVFNSDAFVNTITVKEAGTIAVCYCAITADAVCLDPENWKLVTGMTIKGTKLNQKWLFSTNVVFRFSFEGYGLSRDDSLRIISADGDCTANNYNPNTAAFAFTGLRVSCPVPCIDVGTAMSSVPGDISTNVLGNDHFNCLRDGTGCGVNDVANVTVLSDGFTEIVFQEPHGFLDGDEITFGDNICCTPDCLGSTPECTPDTLAALKGVYEFADIETKNGMAPSTYMNAHRLMTTADPRKILIQVGWPADRRPIFYIYFDGADRALGIIGRGGQWTHHSRAITREEVMATREEANLRVCWRFGGNGGKYVMEVGKITVRDPAPMEGAMLSMTMSVVKQMAPMIVTFKTATGVIGQRYGQAQNSLRLKVTFTQIDMVDIHYTTKLGLGQSIDTAADPTGDTAMIPDDVLDEDDFEEANQATCGKLFLEMWSDDMARGFPMPTGCYYKTYRESNMREIFLLFPPKSGMKSDTTYQLVFNAVMKNLDVEPGGRYMEIYTMDDVVDRPYEAIERGIVTMMDQPQRPGGGVTSAWPEKFGDASDPRFKVPNGFKIVGGWEELLELSSGDSIDIEVMGHERTGKIEGGDIIRIYLWPLTQWRTTSACTAQCVSGGEASFLCGQIRSCVGYPAVPGMSLNILKITMPDEFQPLYGQTKMKLRIGGITMPSGGFFPQKIAAQVTISGTDSYPHYVLSDGDFVWKQPNEGIPVSKVVSTLGGGNDRPFRGQTGNILYARILLSSTLFARDDTYENTKFIIELPPGYTCVDRNPLSDAANNDVNGWMAETTLDVYRGEIPQGRGTPGGDPLRRVGPITYYHGWSVDGNKCIFKPIHPNGVLYAGASFIVKIAVDNPQNALPIADPTNFWRISYYATGPYQYQQMAGPFIFQASGDVNYGSTSSVLGLISKDSCQPTRFARSFPRAVETELRFFFQPEQEVEGYGKVRVSAPDGFLWSNPCIVEHLDNAYYASGADPTTATLKLPGELSCSVGIMKRDGRMFNTADIQFTNIVFANRLYAFKITVQNPSGYAPEQQTGWRVFTADRQGNLLDGTPATVPFTSTDSTSWATYKSDTIDIGVKVVDKDQPLSTGGLLGPMPFAMTNELATVSVLIEGVPSGSSGYIRYQAPPGYLFRHAKDPATDPEYFFIYRADAPWVTAAGLTGSSQGPTADFPPGPPLNMGDSDTLIFAPGRFNRDDRYHFAVKVQVPSQSSVALSNDWIIEFAYNDTRDVAATIPAKSVRALKNSAVDYSNNIVAKENLMEFTLETVTELPLQSYIEIQYPFGFDIPIQCDLVRVRDPMMPEPPMMSCENLKGNPPIIRITANTGPLLRGLHAFGILGENPKVPMLVYASSNTDCATSMCWTFRTKDQDGNELDLSTSAPAFGVNDKMLEARIPSLTEEQRRGTKRDDRPLQPNNIIFAFKLQFDVTKPEASMSIRAPYGFEFPEECLSGIFVSEETVFSLGIRFPPDYDVWPTGVKVAYCRSTGIKANIKLAIEPGSGLMSGNLHLIRVGLVANPLNTPLPNLWTIEVEQESAEPIEGMTLWAFTDTSIVATTTARLRTTGTAARTQNPLKYTFRPFNSLMQSGTIHVEAMLGFQFAHQPSGACSAQLREMPYVSFGIEYPGYVWNPNTGLTCLVDTMNTHTMMLRLRNDRQIYAGLVYEMVIVVYNPQWALESGTSEPTVWNMSSFTPTGLSLDASQITSFRINSVMNLLSYQNPNPEVFGEELRNGGERLPEFELMMRFPASLMTGDTIELLAPADFDLVDISGRCRGFRWIDPMLPEGESADPNWLGPLPNSPPPDCTTDSLVFTIREPDPGIPRDLLIQFGLELYNPLRTPELAQNFWRCTHFDSQDIIKSSKAFQSWDIIPQFEDVEFSLLGPMTAAESISAVRVAFTAVTGAEDIAIEVTFPLAFSFDQASLVNSLDQSIILASKNQIRVKMKIEQGTRYVIDMENVLLGRLGGQTDLQLTSWVGGRFEGSGPTSSWYPGDKRDEKLSFTSGFSLPGQVDITRYQRLYNDYRSDPLTYPVESLWEVQMDRPAYVEFHFFITREVNAGDYMILKGIPYKARQGLLILQEALEGVIPGAFHTPAAETSARAVAIDRPGIITGNEMHIKLQQTLVPFRVYEVVLSVVCPQPHEVAARVDPITWTIETQDGGLLPSNTNDGVSRAFTVVEMYGFIVEVSRAPPMSEPVVSIKLNPGLSSPTALRVVAPLGFNFTAGCLIYGGDDVFGCKPGKEMQDGRATAVLTVPDTGIRGPPPDIRIKVVAPTKTPVQQQWYIEGLDVWSESQIGWGTAKGFEIQQMADAFGSYPAIPGVRAQMVWRFRTGTVIFAGGYLQLVLPLGFTPECGKGQLVAIAFPESGGCDVSDPQNVLIFLNSTIVPAEYAFALYVTPPPASPVRNEFSLILRNMYGNVEDAAVNMPAPQIMDKLRLAMLPMKWTSSRAGYSTVITMGFRALESLPDLVISRTQQISQILVILPVGFQHEVEQLSDFDVLNGEMPLKRVGEWLSYKEKDKLRVTLDLNVSNSWTTLTEGFYEFRFPVRVPAVLPIFNVWSLALCEPPIGEGCKMLSDPGVLVTFSSPGFTLGEQSIGGGGDIAATGASWRPCPSAALLRLFLVSLLLLPCMFVAT